MGAKPMSPFDVIAAALLLLGTLLTLIAGVGVLRFPDAFTRMHAATKSTSLGLTLVLLGAAIRIETAGSTVKLLLVVAFQFLTAPIAAHMVGRAAHRTGHTAHLQVDELASLDMETMDPADHRGEQPGRPQEDG
jgi:multicomponent Na+:H+ antiporter subunit G